MHVSPTRESRAINTVIIQFVAEDVKQLFDRINEKSAQFETEDNANASTKIKHLTFGPSFDKKDNYWYGGFQDPEGNPYWVVDTNCP